MIGVVVAGVSVGVGELVAAFARPIASPVIAVGDRIITLTPESLKRQAISSSGTDDKPLLITGILVLLALIGALVGELALRSLRAGLVATALVGAFGCYCAVTQADGRAGDLVPTAIGTLAALAALVLLVRLATGETLRRPPPADGPAPANRRVFLQGTAATAALAAVTGFGGRAALESRFGVEQERAAVRLPGAKGGSGAVPRGADLGRSGVPWRTPNADFYRIDRALTVPQLDPHTWTLTVGGMVDKPRTLTYAQLLKRPLVERWITLNCVSNEVGGPLVSNALFRGVLLADVLREAGVHAGSDQLLMHGADGMTIGAPTKTVMDGRDALLAVGMNGQPLPLTHGFPVRVIVPGLYGYVSACKWVTSIEATTFADQAGYWVQGGWAADPPLQIASRIDRPRSGGTASVGEPYAVAGVAWDQHVGVAEVQVQVDDGPWQKARLGSVPEDDTWRQWVFPWTPQRSGEHRIRVRAVNADGLVQTSTSRDVFPSGATGLHTVTVRAYV
ncbi:MAG: molybdopterin-dependent oxidoreductase [Jatrophihabitans endophyticus]|nr:molybdopterin-dependent oxidoreductase [Jatrophihabitans endophyticus]